jgi:ArsR family transcriptional regulator
VSYGFGVADALCATHRPGATHTAKARTTGSALTTTSLPRPCGLLLGSVVDHSASDHRQHRRDVLDLIGGHRQVVLVGDDEIGKVAALDRAEIVARLSALADDTRLNILQLIAENGHMRAQEIMESINLSQPSISRYLTQLTATGYLQERRENGAKVYALNKDRIEKTLKALHAFLIGRS